MYFIFDYLLGKFLRTLTIFIIYSICIAETVIYARIWYVLRKNDLSKYNIQGKSL